MLNIRRLDSSQPGFDSELTQLLAFESAQDPKVESAVREILSAVKSRGDTALLETTARFDRWTPANAAALEVDRATLQQALQNLSNDIRAALETAAARIDAYHRHQLQPSWQYTEADGTVLGQQITPLDRAGLYVPGGKAAYPSSVLMNAMAAKVAGVKELVMVTPTPDGQLNETVLAAAALAGVDRVFRIGGAQAIGALAYGTATVPAVDKIVGPGNAYVAAAKRFVFGVVGIDMVAGPSEILIIADGSTDPDWVAMDLFSQAEHDEIAQAVLLCPDEDYIERVQASTSRLLAAMPRADIIRASLQNRGALIKVRDLDQACELPIRLRQNITGAVGRGFGFAGQENPSRRCDFHGPFFVRIAGRLLRRAKSRSTHLTYRPFLFPAGRLRFPETHFADSGLAKWCADVGQGCGHTGPCGKP